MIINLGCCLVPRDPSCETQLFFRQRHSFSQRYFDFIRLDLSSSQPFPADLRVAPAATLSPPASWSTQVTQIRASPSPPIASAGALESGGPENSPATPASSQSSALLSSSSLLSSHPDRNSNSHGKRAGSGSDNSPSEGERPSKKTKVIEGEVVRRRSTRSKNPSTIPFI